MTMIVITIKYITRHFITAGHFAKLTALLLTVTMLSGCLGGTVAQQIARSIATSVADKAVARSMGVEEEQEYTDAQYAAAEKLSNENTAVQRSFTQSGNSPFTAPANHQHSAQLKETEPDDFAYMLATASFLPVKPIAEPLPEEPIEQEAKVEVIQSNQLVRVELFNLLIGVEKNAVYEEARLVGAINLPQKHQWKNWQVGVGVIEHSKKMITFLIPPEFGKLPSGAITTVEIAGAGELNIARYEPENLKHKRPEVAKQAQGF
jgi:hypothetical protein